ncbi:MAG TPA: ATP-binding protein, partial [Gammaproteobacteria bacterium]|nr:ATP-binding protein [Gammaproteobacteria bacterium]
MEYIKRALEPRIQKSLTAMPAVYIHGPRQAGKSTLTQEILRTWSSAEYVTFDDISMLSAAKEDPMGFLQNLKTPAVLDEVQMVPEIFRGIKLQIDKKRMESKSTSNNQYLLTGSTSILSLPKLADALVGRMEIFTLYPFSATESHSSKGQFLDTLFTSQLTLAKAPFPKEPFTTLIQKTTFPEIVCNNNINITKWFESYITTLLYRDIRELAEIEKYHLLPNMLKIMASRVGGLVNDAQMARDLQMNVMTYRRYKALLSQMFLINLVPPWYRNIGKRFVKSPKLFLVDTLMLCYLLGIDDLSREPDPNTLGFLLENFVAQELTKTLAITNNGQLFHFRTNDNKEIDFIVEY